MDVQHGAWKGFSNENKKIQKLWIIHEFHVNRTRRSIDNESLDQFH